ncbi:MAG: hypothetical protein ACOYKE_11515 [Ferruginibacter sp.]
MKTETPILNTYTGNLLTTPKDSRSILSNEVEVKNCHKEKSFKSVDMWQIQKRHFKTELRKPLML